jgi:hypothetical protein
VWQILVSHKAKTYIMYKGELFDDPIVNEVEKQIATELGLEVYSESKHIIGNLKKKEIEQSMINIEILYSYFTQKKSELIKFGTLLYSGEKNVNDGEEYPKGESVPKSQRPVVLKSHGPGIGFGITYAIYFHFLSNDKLTDLGEYLKTRRIPHFKKFQSRLENYYKKTIA